MNSLAIKLDVNDENQQAINDFLIGLGMKPQRRRFHCTVGFMDKCFQTLEETHQFLELLKPKLQIESPLPFIVGEMRFMFRHVIGLLPDEETFLKLKAANESLQQEIQTLSKRQYSLNGQTSGEGYHPHITLWRQRHKDRRYRQGLEIIGDGSKFALELVNYSYTAL